MPELDLILRMIAGAHAVAATGVTAHVLLRKRDVRAASGWIGLVWLSPVFGCVLYWLFGINRVSRRASILNRPGVPPSYGAEAIDALAVGKYVPTHLAALATVGEGVTGRPLVGGNTAAVLRGGDEAYPVMLAAIRSADRSVALAAYLFRHDAVGLAFVDALAGAQARGVETRVLIDGVGGGYVFSSVERALRSRGVAVARFLHDWIPWRMPLLNMRNHAKLLIVDGAIGFTGGMNIGAENTSAASPAAYVDDVHFRFDGPVVGQLLAAFGQQWEFTTGETLTGTNWDRSPRATGAAVARGISAGPDEDIEKLEMILLAALGAARSRIRIVTPYFLPDQRLLSALVLAALRRVEVQIVIPERSDLFLVDWATRAHAGALIDAGCSVFLTPAPFDHAKLMTIDGCWSLIGSANWDVRSLRLNFEFDVEIYDADAGAAIDRLIDVRIARARPLVSHELDSRSLPARLLDAAARLLLPYL